MRSGLGAAALALLCTACVGAGSPGPGGRGFGGDDEGDGPPRPRAQLFVSPSGQPFRAPLGQPYPVAAWFAQADADHDGRLTREEFRADAESWFKSLDLNHDGQIDMPEVTHWEDVTVPELGALAAGGGPGGLGGRPGRGLLAAPGRNELNTRIQGAALFSLINEPHPIRGADADFSLSVSKAEWRAAADRRFELLDVDHDGAITAAELPLTPAQRLGAGRKGKVGGPSGGARHEQR